MIPVSVNTELCLCSLTIIIAIKHPLENIALYLNNTGARGGIGGKWDILVNNGAIIMKILKLRKVQFFTHKNDIIYPVSNKRPCSGAFAVNTADNF